MNAFIRSVWGLSAPYWRSQERWIAWLLLVVVIGSSLGEVYLNVQFNEWNNAFYDSLQETNEAAFFAALFKFSWLAAIFIVNAVYQSYLNQMLQIRWRRWMTGQYLDQWLGRQTYYRMQLAGNPSDNPDQRISDDINQFISLTLSLSLGLLNSVVSLFSFLFILWTLSGPLAFTVSGYHVVIPGYMVWAALFYAIVGTWITMSLGRPLINLNYDQQRYEADFRFSLVRLRENSESVALYRGEGQEKQGFLSRFTSIFDNTWRIMKRQKTLSWFTSGYGQIAVIFPYIVVAPRFFAGKMKLGGVMQTASAFGQVQGSLSYLINAYTDIALWRAVVDRLSGFSTSMTTSTAEADKQVFAPEPAADSRLRLEGLTLYRPDGMSLLENIDLAAEAGESLLIKGPSGCGKSTLLRTLAGLWPYAEGRFALPANARSLFVPQQPYLPLGSLRETLSYPGGGHDIADETLRETLRLCRLDHLAARLDMVDHWSHILSPGEQQRMAFARALLTDYDFVFLDEATSALDEETEGYLYDLLRSRAPHAVIVSVGHRTTLATRHDRIVDLGRYRNAMPEPPAVTALYELPQH